MMILIEAYEKKAELTRTGHLNIELIYVIISHCVLCFFYVCFNYNSYYCMMI